MVANIFKSNVKKVNKKTEEEKKKKANGWTNNRTIFSATFQKYN